MLTALLWLGCTYEIVSHVCLFAGPDEVIYDDVPRENSGSTTGVESGLFLYLNLFCDAFFMSI